MKLFDLMHDTLTPILRSFMLFIAWIEGFMLTRTTEDYRKQLMLARLSKLETMAQMCSDKIRFLEKKQRDDFDRDPVPA